MGDRRDIRNGVNDPAGGIEVKRQVNDDRTPQEREQWAPDVRADPAEPFLPEALRREPTAP